MSRILKLTILLFIFVKSEGKNLKCIQRDYGNGGTVCVCNDSYCDTIEPLGPLSYDEYHVYVSSQSGLRFEHDKKKFETQSRENTLEITVNPKKTFQEIYGFGGAFTDAACLNINSLSRGARKQLLASYFSPQGIEYNFGRVPIGGTDFSTRKYTLDDTPNDVNLENFKLSPEDIDHKIPVILAAQRLSRKRIHLMGAAWTAPPWMKTNNDYICFGLLKLDYYDLWSKYHIKFLEEYEKYGLKFWALTTGNEPTAGLLPYYSFNCMGWTPFSQSKWVAENFGPQLKNSRFNETLIIGIEDQRYTLPWWPKIFFNNQKTRSYVSGIGLHWYWDKYFPPQLLDLTHLIFPDKFILYTEACFVKDSNSAVILGSWKRGEEYASNIISNINHHVGGWIDWNLALDLKGGPNWVNNVVDSPVIVNASANEFYKQPMFYALGHFSKFVPEGSTRIEVQHPRLSNIDLVGFLTPENNIVLVILNKRNNIISMKVHGSERGTAHFTMPDKSIATLIFKNN